MNSEQKSYRVTFSAEMTVRAPDGDTAITAAKNAISDIIDGERYDSIRAVLLKQENFTAEENHYDLEELAKVKNWMAINPGDQS